MANEKDELANDLMTVDHHRARHLLLHRALDELAADFVDITGHLLSQSSVLDLIRWSHEQTMAPTEKRTVHDDRIKNLS